MKKVAVSIIMPSLNVVQYIKECIESAINQTLREIEIICVDAGSTDGTLEILKKYSERDDRIVLVNSKVKSYGAQVNMGIKIAKGDYIAILETDDFIDIGMYEDLYKNAKENDCDYVKCNYYAYWTQKDGSRYFQLRKNYYNPKYYNGVIDNPNAKDICINDLYLWDGIYNKEFLISNNIWFSETRGAAFQDVGFLFQTSILCKKVMYIDKPYYYYCVDRIDSSSNSDKGVEYSFNEYNFVMAKYKEMIMKNKEVEKTLYCRIAVAFYNCYNDSYRIIGREYKQFYEWFYDELKWAFENKIITDDDLKVVNGVSRYLKHYDEYVKEKNTKIEEMKKILGKPEENPIIIFGCGNFGIYAYRWADNEGYHIKAFMDNDSSKWDKAIDNVIILSPEKIRNQEKNTKYIVANNLHWLDIKNQISEFGISEENISVF